MNCNRTLKLLKYLVPAAGLLGLSLRWTLYATGLDDKNLLLKGHWAHAVIWLLTAFTIGAIVYLTRDISGPEETGAACSPSLPAALGCLVAALAMGATALKDLGGDSSALPPIACYLALAGAACLVWIGFCRFAGRQPHFLLHVVVCLTFALRMVCLYRLWRSDPQLQDYCFYMGAYIALMLTAYHHAAFPCGLGSHRKLWRFSLGAVYLCLVSLMGSPAPWLLLCAAAWAWTNLTDLSPRRRRVRPALKLEEDTP